MNFSTQGITCKISDVFLCCEMLDMKHWSKETILSKYGELKKHTLEAFEKALGLYMGELGD